MRLALRPFLQTALTRGRELKLGDVDIRCIDILTALTRGRELKYTQALPQALIRRPPLREGEN